VITVEPVYKGVLMPGDVIKIVEALTKYREVLKDRSFPSNDAKV
jgi:hypothetical protein